MANTLNNKKGRDDKKYKVINLKYEYEGYEGSEKWAIISELSEEELFGLYPPPMKCGGIALLFCYLLNRER